MSSSTPTAVVTGANSGIGKETARGLARAGFHVVLVCRNPERAAAAKAEIDASVPGASTEIVLCDLADQASVRAAAATLVERLDRLDVLVNNAGMTYRRMPEHRTVDDRDPMMAANHLGPFLLTNLLLPLLEESAPARIVNVASDAHKWGRVDPATMDHPKGYGILGFARYGATKLMNILFTRELARRLEGTGVRANCLHPGAVATSIGGPGRVISAITRRLLLSPEEGAATSLHLATSAEGGTVNGAYFAKSKDAGNKLSKRAVDAELGRSVWARTEELVGL